MADADQILLLRGRLGETIPPGGTEADTLFSDDQVGQWVDSTPSMADATVEGWEAKMAHWAGLVNVTDGAASREFSDLMEHAEIMINMYRKQTISGTRGRARIGKIIRP